MRLIQYINMTEFVSILYHCLNISWYGDISIYCPIPNTNMNISASHRTKCKHNYHVSDHNIIDRSKCPINKFRHVSLHKIPLVHVLWEILCIHIVYNNTLCRLGCYITVKQTMGFILSVVPTISVTYPSARSPELWNKIGHFL